MGKAKSHGAYVGGVEHPTHYVWRSMIARCTNSKHRYWSYYGGRGITVCESWRSYERFRADMGDAPKGYELDRNDNDQGYSKENCRWVSHSMNQKNKQSTWFYTNGKMTGTLVECAAYLGISKCLAFWRWKQWGTFEKGVIWHRHRKAR